MPVGLVQLRKFIGVNRAAEPRDLSDNELVSSRNLYPTQADGGELGIRRASQWISGRASAEATGGYCRIFSFRAAGITFVLAWESPGYWYWVNPATNQLEQIAYYPVQGTRKPYTVQWQDRLYCFTGGAPGFTINHAPDLTPPFKFEQLGDVTKWGPTAPKATAAAVYQGSLMLGGFQGSEESMVRFGEVADPNVLLSDTKSIFVGRGIGGRINGVIEVAVEGGDDPIQTYGVILKPGGMWMIQGLPPTSTDNGSLKPTPINKEQGLVSPETIAETPHGVVWCSGGNVWIAPTGAKPIRIGEAIRPVLEVTPQINDTWHGVYFGGFYRLTIPSQNVVDSRYEQVEQWWCDLRGFPKYTWWGPLEVPSASMLADGPPGKAQRLLSLVRRYTEGTNSYRLELEELEVDTPDLHDHYGTPDVSTSPCDGEVRFRELDLGDPHTKKIIQAVEVHMRSEAEVSMTVRLVGDGGVVTSEQTGFPDPQGFVLGQSPLTIGPTLGSGFRTITYTPPSGRRYIATVLQPVVKVAPLGGKGTTVRLRELILRARPLGRRPSTKQGDTE